MKILRSRNWLTKVPQDRLIEIVFFSSSIHFPSFHQKKLQVYIGYYFGTPVAVKRLFTIGPDQKHLVERELAMLVGVNHPNIVHFLGLCDHETGIYLITEYVEHGKGEQKKIKKNQIFVFILCRFCSFR
jgi:serine/threonine protein kinase